MYDVGNFVEMKKPHACTIKSTGKKQIVGKLFEWVRILKFAVQIANIS